VAVFEYKATDKQGKLVKGTLSAKNEKEVESYLTDKELKAVVVTSQNAPNIGFGGNFPINEKISLCRYLALIINAGISLSEGLDLLAEGSTNKVAKRVLGDVANSTRRGTSLFDSFSTYRNFFGEVFLTMIKTGEASGSLASSFAYLGRQFEQEKELRQKVLGALLYPIIIVSLMFVVGTVVFAFVLPRLAKVFMKLDLDFPLYTRILFSTSLYFEKNLIMMGAVFFGVIITLILFFRSKKGKDILYYIMVRVPGIKKIILDYNLVRFTQSLSSLLKSAVPVTEAVDLSVHSLSFVKKDQLSEQFTKKLTRGIPMSQAFAEAKIFPSLTIQLIKIGEKTGSLEKTLSDLGEFYELEVENSLKNFVTILEPMLMICVGIGVGAMVISIISPIYGLIGKLQAGL
jgi:type IV pilus assembly protein PilC